MQSSDFKSIVKTFADPGSDILIDNSQLVISVNGDLIQAEVTQKSGDIYITDGGAHQPASRWIANRLARLPLLATRLLDNISPTKNFVSPAANFLTKLEATASEKITNIDDALAVTSKALKDKSPLETSVLYITSDAGEGKTSLINQLAINQAKLFSSNQSDWLLVPIPLGGRHFLRFDDLTIGALQNRYRFQFLYYNSFIALVKMGFIVPAYDGFEEMLVESSSGEALSAMGILVDSLDSQGAIVVAARKAYFEFENLKTQERLFDTIRTNDVSFQKLELQRWNESQFLAYCKSRNVQNGKELYRKICERLGADHALLTRAVLVKRLLDVATSTPSLDALLEKIQSSTTDFFTVFVTNLIDRESKEKWLDRSGKDEIGSPLLSVAEHCELLSLVALTMWESRVDYLKQDSLEFVSDLYCETSNKSPFQSSQIRERIGYHAMLTPSQNAHRAVEFDHDEFRLYFLGEGIAAQMSRLDSRAKTDCFSALRRSILPAQAKYALTRAIQRTHKDKNESIISFLIDVARMDAQASYTHENCSSLIGDLLNELPQCSVEIKSLSFPADTLRDKKLTKTNFSDCFFSPSSLELTTIESCAFRNCSFAHLKIYASTHISNVTFDNCKIDAISLNEQDIEIWHPIEIQKRLSALGIEVLNTELNPAKQEQEQYRDQDPEIRDLGKIVRYFMRSTHISESVMLIKLGERGRVFIDECLPQLLKKGIMEEIDNRGGGDQRRFRFGMPLQKLNSSIYAANGSYLRLLEIVDSENG